VPEPPAYDERLSVPVWWWVVGVALVPLFGAEIHAGFGWIAAIVTDTTLSILVGWALVWLGRTRVTVTADALDAGGRRLDLMAVAAVVMLDRDDVRRVLGRDADASATLVTRPWLHTAVQVRLADATPYWVVSTRHPAAVAAAVRRAPAGAPPSPAG
jgi:Protein of unknown function (DUF3093)